MPTVFPCPFSPWSPGIGDNHFMGWVSVAVYLAATFASLLAARRGTFPVVTRQREQLFWWFCCGTMAFLAVNKQLDLQSLLTAVARCVAVNEGWYENRRIVQRQFVLAIMAGGALSVLACGLWMRRTFARTGLAILGLGIVGTFVAARAASFHHFDRLIDLQLAGVRLNWLLELPGPLLILFAAFLAKRRPSAASARPDCV